MGDALPSLAEGSVVTRIYCVRHGQSVANAGGLTMEHAAIPLSPLGVVQAAALAELLDVEPSRILTSSYVRAVETAAPLCARWQRQAEVHPLLHEFSALDADRLLGAGMRALRRFQTGLQMPKCAVYELVARIMVAGTFARTSLRCKRSQR